MAVFTLVSEAEARPFVSGFGLGDLLSLTPIAEGVENTNYRIETERGRFVLTLFENRTDAASLPFCLGLTALATDRGLPCARPVRDGSGAVVGELNGRPASILEWLPGAWLREPAIEDHRAAGALLARLHLETAEFTLNRANPVGPAARQALFDRYRTVAGHEATAVLDRVEPWLAVGDAGLHLPRGPIHADYFPDNLLFDAGRPSGLIDFYFACTDAYAYDLAIALSAWGFDAEGAPLHDAIAAFLEGYEDVRPLSDAEHEALPTLGAVAAVRFTLTRLHDRLFHDSAKLVTPKDPAPFLRRLDYWTAASTD